MGRTHKDNSYNRLDKKIRNSDKGKKKPFRNLNVPAEGFFDHEYDSYKREFEND